jgi:GT2 family glycosyltransferase
VTTAATTSQAGLVVEPKPREAARVAVVIVTWNRRDMVEGALEAIARQDYPIGLLDVVVVDNASTDGTLEGLSRRLRPEVVVDNATREAHNPAFRPRPVGERLGNTPGFGSLTLVRNADNLGGCGGFNTGLAYVEAALAMDRGTRMMESGGSAPPSGRPEFVWLVDDDIDLPPDALSRLVAAMRTDARIGIVGSRTVDLRDRKTTIETTIYQERATGVFADEPDAAHPMRAGHEQWARSVGGVKGRRAFTGLRDVDIVSASSMLARWSAVEQVGFWDRRYFIYCDDADWCLRFARGGWRVVLNLDAVVFHLPWHHKLTPARLYYAQRNLLWTIRKAFDGPELRRVMRTRTRTMLATALASGLSHRLFHGEVARRAVDDAIRDRGGKADFDAGAPVPLAQVAAAIRGAKGGPDAGASGRPLRVAFVIHRPIAVEWAAGVRSGLGEALGPGRAVEWFELVRNDVPGSHELKPVPGVRRAVYAPHLKSRLRRQAALVKARADLLVIFDGACDLGLVRTPRWILHVASARPGEGILERGRLRARLAFLGRWSVTALRALMWARSLRPAWPEGKFGGVGTMK